MIPEGCAFKLRARFIRMRIMGIVRPRPIGLQTSSHKWFYPVFVSVCDHRKTSRLANIVFDQAHQMAESNFSPGTIPQEGNSVSVSMVASSPFVETIKRLIV